MNVQSLSADRHPANIAIQSNGLGTNQIESPQRRISLVISSLRLGGAQRVLVTLADEWVRQGHSVSLITNAGADQDFYSLPKSVPRESLNLERPNPSWLGRVTAPGKRILRLRRALQRQRPDIVISFCDRTNLETLLATRGLKVPVLASERTNPRQNPQRWPWPLLRRHLYPLASRMVVQTAAVGQHTQSQAPGTRVTTIANPLRPLDENSPQTNRAETIVAVGRLDPCKGLDTLIAAFVMIHQRHPSWTMQIVGEGSERTALTALIAKFNLQHRIHFVGQTQHPEEYLSTAGIYVLPSRWEGFPNSLLEAMAAGCPCVAADCDFGPAELIQHEKNGLLTPVDNPTELANHLDHLMRDAPLRAKLGQNACQVRRTYNVAAIIARWDSLIHDVIAATG
ncbi:MAG: glycosyltransferase family 4 protein [Planctomycetales bacterium]|nr:glycosyltransferase family 4 protein [Planctomycetales bacterium]